LPFAKHAETVAQRGAALNELIKEITDRSTAIMERREVKAGAVYSGSNLSHMQRIHDVIGKVKKDIGAAHSDMAALIAKAKKPEAKTEETEIDVAALRMQSMRIEGEVLATLSR